MSDSTELEHVFSHAAPQLFASIISLTMVAIGMFFYNWQLVLALFWVVPIAAGILFITKKKQLVGNKLVYDKKRNVTGEI